jgi:AcrR family transcriptional regulator
MMQAMPTKEQTRRRYTNTRRTAQAAQTRLDIVNAAIALFSENGWSGTTVATIAERAGVAVETVYSGFGSKKALLRQAMDVSVVGDAEPVPYFQRADVQALAHGPLDDRMRRGIEILAEVHERSSGVFFALLEAASSDQEIAAWRTEAEQNRKLDTRRSFELIFGKPMSPETLDLIWALYSPEVYRRLIDDAGWTREQYEAQMLEASKRILNLPRRRAR